MALRQIISRSFMNSTSRVMITRSAGTSKPHPEDYSSVQYNSDGERIECGLKFKPEGDMTEEELSSIIESARAKDFDDSINRVVLMKCDP